MGWAEGRIDLQRRPSQGWPWLWPMIFPKDGHSDLRLSSCTF